MSQSKDAKAKDTAKLMYSTPEPKDVEVCHNYTANALPTRILHNGPLDFSRIYWDPKETQVPAANMQDNDPTQSHTVYFRGRKLFGQRVAVPATHTGLILRATEETRKDLSLRNAAMQELDSQRDELDAEAYDEEVEELRAAASRGELEEQIGVMEKIGQLDDMIIWGHEALPSAEDGGITRLNEWHALAAAMHEH